jgi:hypothetical protein
VGLKPLVDAATQVEYGAFYRSVVGAVVGGFQWLVLRRTLDRAGWWVLATFFGWVLFNELNFMNLFGAAPGIAIIPDLIHGLIFGVILGVS